MARKHIFPISSGEIDWRKAATLQAYFIEALKAEQADLPEAVVAVGSTLIEVLDQAHYLSEEQRARLARLCLRLALRGDYAPQPSAEADPDLGVFG